MRPDAADQELAVLTKRLKPAFAGYVALLLLGLFLPAAAVIGYLGVALFRLIPFGLFRQRRSGTLSEG